MRIQFLGTGAADWPFELITPNLEEMKERRHTSSVLINDTILVDPVPGLIPYAKQVLQVDLKKITDIFVTHSHGDHWNLSTLHALHKLVKHPMNLYFHTSAGKHLGLGEQEMQFLNLHPLKRGGSVTIENIKCVCLEANHLIGKTETGSHYIFTEKRNNKEASWFYGCDGGWVLNKTWNYLMKTKLDGIILDATVGELPYDFRIGSHNTMAMVRLLTGAFKEQKILKENGRVVLSHLARTLHGSIEETQQKMKAEGFIMAYDGMVISECECE